MFPSACDSGGWCPDGKTGFPTTPWTGIVSIAILLLVLGYMFINVAEFMFHGDLDSGKLFAQKDAEGNTEAGEGQAETETAAPGIPTESRFRVRSPYFKQSSVLRSRYPVSARTMSRMNGMINPLRLGVLLRPDHSYDDREESRHVDILPHMLGSFGWTWVFADGLFFLGMLTPQNSVQTDDAVAIFVRVIFCRLLQLTALKLIPYAFEFTDNSPRQDEEKKQYRWHFVAW